MNIDLASAETFAENSYFPLQCSELLDAGVQSVGAMNYKTALEEANKDPKFQVFSDTCAKKGYFNGVEEGSVEYLQRNAKLIKKFREKTGATSAKATPTAVGKLDSEKAAEDKKAAGNEAIKKKDYELAIQLYSEALQFSASGPNTHIYYANRSAAYCHLSDYKRAVADCESAIKKCPTYTKAYSRLGLAEFFLQNYAASAAAYEKAAELEPDNKAHKDSARQAKQKLEEQEAVAAAPVAARGGGMPDLASMMGGLGGAGGGGMMAMAQQMMQNPEMMQMAQKMMQDPNMMSQAQQMMQNNPDAVRQAMASMGGAGGGGAPDMAQMAQMAQMFGGAGGGTSGSQGGIPDFSGFSK